MRLLRHTSASFVPPAGAAPWSLRHHVRPSDSRMLNGSSTWAARDSQRVPMWRASNERRGIAAQAFLALTPSLRHTLPPAASMGSPPNPYPSAPEPQGASAPGHDRALIWRSCRSRGTAPSTSPPPQPTCSCGRHSRRSGPCTPCRPGSMSSTRWRRRGPRRRRREASRASR